MSETRSTAPPGGEPKPGDATTAAPMPVDAADLAALNGQAPPTDDTPTIISRNSPRQYDEVPGGLRGRRLAHFELIEPIGVGGMAAVIRARDTQLDRLVALKILPPDMAKDPENVRRFHQEARSAARLDHENIARVFYCGEDQGLHFIAFEFVEGENLRTLLERRGRLPAAEAIHYVLQVAAGLAHASQRGVVHRDIKPSNIIVTPTGRAKLVDMGLARSLERQDHDLTQSGVTLGTFDYISPEQALEPRDADVRSDIYSLGCTFYHVLTGQPPVPEGTAAKKLQHHQHIKPRDPRELAPGLPDEVAVILDRMMAKRPQDRYQSPEQLVHHLLLAARNLGGPSNVPEGVLSVEAALPPPPGNRPLLLVGLAAALVVLLIVALEAFHRPTANPAAPPGSAADKESASKPDGAPPGASPQAPAAPRDKPGPEKGPDQPTQPQPTALVYDDAAEMRPLAEWLKAADVDAPKEIRLGNDVDLPLDADVGLALTGPKVTLQAKPGRRPTIRFTHDSRAQLGSDPWAAVSIDSPNAVVRGVRILIDGRNADVAMVGLRLRGPAGAVFTVDNCELIQARPGTGEKRLTSLAVSGADAAPAGLTLNACRWLSFTDLKDERLDRETLLNGPFGGDDAVLRDGPVSVTATDCAFGPHAAAFRLEGGKGAAPAPLTLNHCSVLEVGPSAVFDVRAGAAVALDLHACLFSHPDGASAGAAPAEWAALLRQADPDDRVTCTDRDNRYHGLDAYWMIGNDDDQASWDEFKGRAEVKAPSLALRDSPWRREPLQLFHSYSFKDDRAEDHFLPAFQVKESDPKLRVSAPSSEKGLPVGVERLGGASTTYVALLQEADRQAEIALKKQRIVEPGKSDSANRVYGRLEEALSACEPGDEILLRFDGPLPVQPSRLDKSNVQDVTIRAAEGRRPVLRLVSGKDRDAEPAMFRVYDGKLTLEGLQLLLQPDDDYRRQSLIDLVGQGQCGLKDCVVTLDHAAQSGTHLDLALLSDPGKAMMTPARSADQSPQLRLDNCFVRGDGDLIACAVSRPLALEMKDSLAALKGCLLNVEAGPEPSASAGGSMALTLTKVTAYLTGNLIRLRAGKDFRSLTPVRCAPTDCLFVAAARDPQSLVHVDDSELDERGLGTVLTWEGGGRIDYGNFTTMLDEAPPNEEMPMARPVMQDKWESTWGKNAGDRQLKPRWASPAPPAADDSFAAAAPLQFRPQEPADGCGADVDRLERLLQPPK